MYGTLIQTVTVGAGGATSIAFTSIAGTYTDLMLVLSIRTTYPGADALTLSLNGSSSGTFRYLIGNGSTASSGTRASTMYLSESDGTYTASTFNSATVYFPNYAGSTYKSISSDAVTENNATTAQQYISAGLFSSTSAITSIDIAPASGTNYKWAQYSTASLYGILKGSGGATAS